MTRKIEGVDIEIEVGVLGNVGMFDRRLVMKKATDRMLGEEGLEVLKVLILMNHDQCLALNQECRECMIQAELTQGLRYHVLIVVEFLSSNLPVPQDSLDVYDQPRAEMNSNLV